MNTKLKICNKSPHENPTYAKPGDSGMDLRAWIYWEDNSGVNPQRFRTHAKILVSLRSLLPDKHGSCL